MTPCVSDNDRIASYEYRLLRFSLHLSKMHEKTSGSIRCLNVNRTVIMSKVMPHSPL